MKKDDLTDATWDEILEELEKRSDGFLLLAARRMKNEEAPVFACYGMETAFLMAPGLIEMAHMKWREHASAMIAMGPIDGGDVV